MNRLVFLLISSLVTVSAQAEVVKAEGQVAKRRFMPGIGSYTFTENSVAPAVTISAGANGNQAVSVSSRFPNRFATPFAAPRVIDIESVNIEAVPDGQNIYLLPKSNEPVVIYVTGSEPGDQVISLTLIPKAIPAQTILLQLDVPGSARTQKVDSYTQQLMDLLRKVASGQTPEGYVESKIEQSIAEVSDVNIVPEARYSGTWLDVYRYRVRNNKSETIELSETSFYQKGVRAVSIYPNLQLEAGQETTVYVVADKTALDGAKK